MSYEAWGEPDEDYYMTREQALDSGWWDPDTAGTVLKRIRDLDFMVEPGNRLHAQLVILQVEVGLVLPGDPLETWARTLLGEPTG